jgi:hypothetical protein
MCRFFCRDFEYRLQCPVDKIPRTVRVQSYPRLRGHFLDVVACDAVSNVEKLTCRKACRDALENGDYWRESDLGLPV